ncbi:MAG: LacI family DNA-binding transcriptional regulator [Acidobacteria bacterium]|nr:LacI family DNA-binding transcriptional regulator [Acidobacteriota bacterium]
MSAENIKPAGIKQIADALGISIGTVDRALHTRPGVSATTRDRVLKMAEKLRYKPNVAARSLKLNRTFRVGVFLPREIGSFFDALRDGIRAAAEQVGASVALEFYSYPRLGVGDVAALKKNGWDRFDGLILAPAEPLKLAAITKAAAKSGKPMVFVATDAPGLTRCVSIATDAVVSGSVAAELLGRFVRETGPVALFTGSLKIEDHAEKCRGFSDSLSSFAPHLKLLPVIETHESEEEAYREAVALLKRERNLCGVYINTANSVPVLRAIRESKRALTVIATDLFPELVRLIESGLVTASLHQRPFTQGRLAFEAMYRALQGGEVSVTRVAPHVVLRSNLGLFTPGLERES